MATISLNPTLYSRAQDFAKSDMSTVAEKKTRRKKYKAEDFAGIWDDENYMAAEDINKAIRDTRHVKSSRDEIWDKL